jgi:hypothetical protein
MGSQWGGVRVTGSSTSSERVDDIPLLLEQMQRMGLPTL